MIDSGSSSDCTRETRTVAKIRDVMINDRPFPNGMLRDRFAQGDN